MTYKMVVEEEQEFYNDLETNPASYVGIHTSMF